MAAEKELGVLERVKSLVAGSGNKLRVPVSGLNLPWLLARCDCAFQELIPLLKGTIFIKENSERCEYYSMLTDMVGDILDSLSVIYRESLKTSNIQKIEPDPSIPVLQVIYHSFQALQVSAVLTSEMQNQKAASESFAGTGILTKFNGIEDSVSNMEVEMLHNISELVESIVPAMQKNSEQRKKSLSKNGAECYLRAKKELSLYYSGLSAKN
ncbi:MAG: hypothetical protein E7040_12985 [Lentisphaerae bacterium]|nr:hypothetical protein [Lentisphaerota bacterium]